MQTFQLLSLETKPRTNLCSYIFFVVLTINDIIFICNSLCRGLIVPSKEKKKEKKSKLMRKLGRSKSESVSSQVQRASGLVGLLETMRAQLEVCYLADCLSSY